MAQITVASGRCWQYSHYIGRQGGAGTGFGQPVAVVTDKDGVLFVANRGGAGRISKVTVDEDFLKEFGRVDIVIHCASPAIESADVSSLSYAAVEPYLRVYLGAALELVGAEYAASSDTNVRGGPGTDYKVVGSLTAAATVQVIAKVEDKSWYLIGQGGVATGFVYTTLLDPTGQIGGGEPAPEGEVAEIEVVTQVTCRTIEQQVTLDDGTVHTEQIEACQKPDGSWEMA